MALSLTKRLLCVPLPLLAVVISIGAVLCDHQRQSAPRSIWAGCGCKPIRANRNIEIKTIQSRYNQDNQEYSRKLKCLWLFDMIETMSACRTTAAQEPSLAPLTLQSKLRIAVEERPKGRASIKVQAPKVHRVGVALLQGKVL